MPPSLLVMDGVCGQSPPQRVCLTDMDRQEYDIHPREMQPILSDAVEDSNCRLLCSFLHGVCERSLLQSLID